MKTNKQKEYTFLQKLLNKANIGWWEADLKTESYVCSEFISRLLGIDEDGVISFEDFNKRILREDQHHTTSYSFDKLQQTVEEVYLLDTPQGEVWIRSKRCFQETDEEGNTKIYGIAETQDSPHMASAYRALHNSERILHNIYKNIPVGIELYNKNGDLIDLNKKELEMFHITHKEKIIGINIFENPVLPEEIKPKIKENEDIEFTFQYDFSKINGYYESEKSSGFLNLTTRITTLYDHARQPINYLLINVDKTENTIAYNKIQEFKNFFELVGDYAKVGYAHFDALSRDGYALSSWYKNVGEEEGTPLPEIIGIHSHFHPEDRAVMLDFLAKVIKGESSKLCRDVRIRRADGNYTWTRVNVLVRNYRPQDNIIEMLCINFDITELKETERMLIGAKEKAEEADRLKSAFLANMSHEIRTPLNALSGFSSILTDNNIDAEMRKQCNDIIQQNSDLLLKLIDDVVDLSSLERGKMQFRFEIHDAVSLCQNVIDTVDKIKQTSASIVFQTSLGKLELYTDEARLQQLLINLLINATKFTTEGRITLTLEKQDGMALFAVTDTGCGIAPEKQGKIFHRFEKLDENVQGSGLGLSICQLIVERFGGEIWIDTEYKDGSRFVFTHPIPNTTPNNKEAEL